MKDIGKSSLITKMGRLVGFGYTKHPIRPNWWLQIVFYWIAADTELIICMSEGRGKRRPENMRPHLGEMVPGAGFAPYAQRGVQGIQNWEQFKEVAQQGWPDIRFEWWEEDHGDN